MTTQQKIIKNKLGVVRLPKEEKRRGKRPIRGWWQIPFFTFSPWVLHLKNWIVRWALKPALATIV